MTRFEDELRQRLHVLGRSADNADLLDRSLSTTRRLRRARGVSAATVSAVLVAGIGAGAWAAVAPDRDRSTPPIGTSLPSPTTTALPTPPSSSPASPPASASSFVTTALPIVWCPTEDVRDHLSAPPSPPSSPATVALAVPSNLIGNVAQYEDAVTRNSVLAPAGWQCAALIAEDGSSSLVVSPSIDKQTGSAPSGQPAVSVSKSGASTVQAAEGACPLVIWPTDLVGGETCSKRPTGETSAKIDANTTSFVDPPTATNPYSTVGWMAYFPKNPTDLLQVVTCSLPEDQRDVCDASLAAMTSSTSAVLPLVHCAEDGVPPASPTATSTPMPPGNAGKGLSVYTDPQGRLSVLAPENWVCQASTTADGTLSLVVVPVGTSTAPPHPYTPDSRQGVAAILAAPGTAEANDLTCAIMPGAVSKPSSACPHKAPSEERYSPDAPNVVEFDQPAGVVGDGALGGGTFTTFGRIITRASQAGNEIAFISCALPDSQFGLCQDVATGFAPFGIYYPLPGG